VNLGERRAGGYQSEGWLGEETSFGRAAGALMRACCTGKHRLLGPHTHTHTHTHTERERESGETPEHNTRCVEGLIWGVLYSGLRSPVATGKAERELMVVRPWFPEGRGSNRAMSEVKWVD
jgi:hypothetical protein